MHITVRRICAATAAAALLLGSLSANAALSEREKALIPVAASAANGNVEALRVYLNRGLDRGVSVNEFKVALVQVYPYAGFPRALTALGTLKAVSEYRKEHGIKTVQGEDTAVFPQQDSLERGTKVQAELTGLKIGPAPGNLYEFVPEIDYYLKAHLFGDVFTNPALDFRAREIVTISVQAALPAQAQLRGHLQVSMHNGITVDELGEYISTLRDEIGDAEADLAARTLKEVLEAQQAKK